jgi:hypothetical protein
LHPSPAFFCKFNAGNEVIMEENKNSYNPKDADTRSAIIDTLRNDPGIDASKIEVEVKDGHVLLKGLADTEKEKQRSEGIAASVAGVKSVENHLHIQIGLIHALSSIAAQIQGDIIDDKDDDKKK